MQVLTFLVVILGIPAIFAMSLHVWRCMSDRQPFVIKVGTFVMTFLMALAACNLLVHAANLLHPSP